ncbi:O-antigen polymerase [Streptococcus sp. DD11]|uniref:O-antigen polymerase n=1 Tax=Streptococcus sp. DD11 TaxID=1777879 RepID=UPI0007958A07|nr:O-antigen polymerase [Streptococcus sp. DD11]KXT85152.1 O-antigen polymerase [Streptococcus sp. DD11]
MVFLLILGGLFLLFLTVRMMGKDYANPVFIYLAVWLIASISTAFYSSRWGEEISLITVIIILIGNAVFLMGVLLSSNLFAERKLEIKLSQIKVSNLCVLLVLLFFAFAIRFVYSELVYLAAQSKQLPGGVFRTIELARHMTTNYDFSLSRLSLNLLRINFSLGIVFFYFFCESLFSGQDSIFYKGKLLLISMISLGISLLSTGRTELLGLISGYAILYILFFSKYYSWKDRRYGKKLFRMLLTIGLVFLGLFMVIGTFVLNRVDSQAELGILDNLIKYMGSPIQALDYYLKNPSLYDNNQVFGENTLIAVYGTLKSLGLSSYDLTPFLPVIHFNGDKTNVYTIYYYFIKDFGYFSVLILQLVYGFFYGSFYYSIKKRYFTPLKAIVFALFAYPLVISFFQETLLSLLTTHINRIVYAFAIYIAIDLFSRVRFTTRGRKVSV